MLQLYILSYKLINQTVYIFPLHFLQYTMTHSVKYFKSDIKAVFDKNTGFFFCISASGSLLSLLLLRRRDGRFMASLVFPRRHAGLFLEGAVKVV